MYKHPLKKVNFVPQVPYFCPPRISVTHLTSPEVSLDALVYGLRCIDRACIKICIMHKLGDNVRLVQLTEALAADTVRTLVSGLRSAILRTNSGSSSPPRAHSRDHLRGNQQQHSGALSADVQCKALKTTLPHGGTLAHSLKQVLREPILCFSEQCCRLTFHVFTCLCTF